jgi:hypothetical protein
MKLYSWPFYPIFIAWVAKLTNLSFECSAYVLNAALSVIIVTTFITLIKDLGGSRTAQLIGAIVILSHPRANHYQHYIIRYFGFCAFFLLSLLYLIRYYRLLRWRFAVGWGICISFATLFRIEGLTLACFTPLVLLFRSNTGLWDKLRHTLTAYSLNIITAMIGLTWWLSIPHRSSVELGRLTQYWDQLQNCFTFLSANLQNKAHLINQIVLDTTLVGWGLTMAIFGLTGIYLCKFVITLGPLHTLLCGHAVHKKLMPAGGGVIKVLIFYTMLNLLIPVIWFGQTGVISHRFLMPATLLFLLWTPFSLESIFRDWRDKKPILTGNALLFPLISIVFLIMFVHAFVPPDQSKSYIVSAGLWLKQNVPAHAKVYTNCSRLSFYADRQVIALDSSDDLTKPEWTSEDFIALRVDMEEYLEVENRLTASKLQPIKIFANEDGDRTVILKIPAGEN